jgi:hypothetical protein
MVRRDTTAWVVNMFPKIQLCTSIALDNAPHKRRCVEQTPKDEWSLAQPVFEEITHRVVQRFSSRQPCVSINSGCTNIPFRDTRQKICCATYVANGIALPVRYTFKSCRSATLESLPTCGAPSFKY